MKFFGIVMLIICIGIMFYGAHLYMPIHVGLWADLPNPKATLEGIMLILIGLIGIAAATIFIWPPE